jgi:hypothetical protein
MDHAPYLATGVPFTTTRSAPPRLGNEVRAPHATPHERRAADARLHRGVSPTHEMPIG